MKNWLEHFALVADPRRQSALTQHLLSEILGLALCALLCALVCAADNFVEMALFCRERQEFLQEALGFSLGHGVPSHDTFNRVFAPLEPKALEGWLLEWVGHWQQEACERHVCIDGKVARGSFEAHSNVCAHDSERVCQRDAPCAVQCARARRRGENRVARTAWREQLLALLDLDGALVSGDAAFFHKDIARIIHEAGATMCWRSRATTPPCPGRCVWAGAPELSPPRPGPRHAQHGTRAPRRGARAMRACIARVQCVSGEDGGLDEKTRAQWPGLHSMVRVERVRAHTSGQKAGHTSQSAWFYLSSLPPDEETLAVCA